MPSGLMPCSAQSCFQNSNPTGGGAVRRARPGRRPVPHTEKGRGSARSIPGPAGPAPPHQAPPPTSAPHTPHTATGSVPAPPTPRASRPRPGRAPRPGPAAAAGPRGAHSLWLPHWPSCRVMISRGIAAAPFLPAAARRSARCPPPLPPGANRTARARGALPGARPSPLPPPLGGSPETRMRPDRRRKLRLRQDGGAHGSALPASGVGDAMSAAAVRARGAGGC